MNNCAIYNHECVNYNEKAFKKKEFKPLNINLTKAFQIFTQYLFSF